MTDWASVRGLYKSVSMKNMHFGRVRGDEAIDAPSEHNFVEIISGSHRARQTLAEKIRHGVDVGS